MQRIPSQEGRELPSAMMRRASSVSCERLSIPVASSMASPPPVSPEPAFIAASAASQIVTSDHQSQMDAWFGEENENTEANSAMVMPAALAHINSFLDQLLYGMLATARSTSIAALRPAVSEILKPRLAKDAINGADEELQDFASGRDDDGLTAIDSGTDFTGVADLNLIWRRTRLRCMVYTRLGDLEEEDEEAYIEREHQEEAENRNPRSSEDLSAQDLGLLSPPSAIFLTSILEFIGEQSLLIAGDAAYNRFHNRQAGALKDSSERILVEESDVEKIAFDTRLGRLWRSWKKKIRSPGVMSPRLMSRESIRGHRTSSSASNHTSRKASISELDESDHRPDLMSRRSVAQVMEEPAETSDMLLEPHEVPLPHSPIEQGIVPFVGKWSRRRDLNRPNSMVEYTQGPPIHSTAEEDFEEKPARSLHHQRSTSMPTPQTSSFSSAMYKDFQTPKAMSESSIATEPTPEAGRKDVDSEGNERSTATMQSDPDRRMMYDGMHLDGASPTSRAPGMSKVDFDRQMHALEREIRDPAKQIDDASTVDTERTDTEAEDPSRKSTESDYDLPIETNLDSVASEGTTQLIKDGNDEYVTQGNRVEQKHQDHEGSEISAQSGILPKQSIPEYTRTRIVEPQPSSDIPEGKITTNRTNGHDKYYTLKGLPYVQTDNNFYDRPPAQPRLENAFEEPQKRAESHSKIDADVTKSQYGAPPLTPLRELMEAAPDTSDEASSLAPSQDTSKHEGYASDRYLSGEIPPMGSSALPTFTNANSSDLKKQLPPASTGTERATVQRVVPPSPLSAREPATPLGRTSTSSNRDLRAVQTTSSSASQKAKGLAGRDSGETQRKPLTTRQSSEGSDEHLSGKRSMTISRSGDPQLDFDNLIKSDETVKYTLTPQSMRDMESDSPRHQPRKRTETQELADFIRNSGPEESEAGRPSTSRSIISGKGFSGLKAHSVNSVKRAASGTTTAESSKTKSNAGRAARDARNNSGSTRDFADFLRSTGPEITPSLQQSNQSILPKAMTRSGRANSNAKNPSEQLPSKKITKPNPATTAKRTDSQSKKTGLRLQAREPAITNETTFDLAEFIRQGPMGNRGDDKRVRHPPSMPGASLSPKKDQRLVNGYARDGINSTASTESNQNSSVFAQSVHSTNSRTGLLDSPRSMNAQYHAQSAQHSRKPARGDQPPQPVRKQRRLKDPYAIDTESERESDVDDQDNVDIEASPEPLVDMFHSIDGPHAPPMTTTVPSAFSKQPSNRPEPPQKLQYPSIRDRASATHKSLPSTTTNKATPAISTAVGRGMGVPSTTPTESRVSTRNAGSHQQPLLANKISQSSPRGRNGGPTGFQAPQLPPIGGNTTRNSNEGDTPRATSPHLVSSPFTSKLDQYRPTTATYAAHMDKRSPRSEHGGGGGGGGDGGGVGGGYFKSSGRAARAEREDQGGTGELADFLKNSGPPEQGKMMGFAAIEEPKERKGLGRVFGRKKK